MWFLPWWQQSSSCVTWRPILPLQLLHSTLTHATPLPWSPASCLIASVIMSQCLSFSLSAWQWITVCLSSCTWLLCFCALITHHSWLLLASLPVSWTWHISFVCSKTQNNSDELEIASADLPSLSASCTHSLQLLAGNQTQFHVEFMTLDGAVY